MFSAAHVVLQAPQLSQSVIKFAHAPLHNDNPALQAGAVWEGGVNEAGMDGGGDVVEAIAKVQMGNDVKTAMLAPASTWLAVLRAAKHGIYIGEVYAMPVLAAFRYKGVFAATSSVVILF